MVVPDARDAVKQKRELEKSELLVSLQGLLELPMVILSFIMLLLFIMELTTPLSPGLRRTFNLVQWVIWMAFVIEYAVKLALADNKIRFMRDNVLMTISIVLPVFRIFRVVKAARAVRSIGTLRIITVGNRTIRKLGILFEKRRLQYFAAVVAAVTVLSAAGVYFLERGMTDANITTFGGALWWASGTVTTVGTELYPISAEGRALAIIVMVFGVTFFGYVAGSLASFFVNIDQADAAEEKQAQKPEHEDDLDNLLSQISELEARIQTLNQMLASSERTDTSPRA